MRSDGSDRPLTAPPPRRPGAEAEGDLSARVMDRCTVLARFSEEAGMLTRRYGTPELRRAGEAVAGWMRSAGMSVRWDAVGNVIGRYEGSQPAAKTLILGSHIDSVRNAGRYDGPLGVLVALACVEAHHAADDRLPIALEVVAFADEEGARYGTAFLGSSVFAGSFDPADLELRDAQGITLAEAIREYGGDPAALADSRRDPADLLGYAEVHIEQGVALEERNLPVAVVSGVAGQSRVEVTLTGVAGHAGTVRMSSRRDALCAASELVLATEALARREPGVVATVGRLTVGPGVHNVIPDHVTLTIDVRHIDDDRREAAVDALRQRCELLASERNVQAHWDLRPPTASVAFSPHLQGLLSEAIAAEGSAPVALDSGAGHDAMVMADVTDAVMLFVRCRDGVSHHPDEAVAEADVAAAIRVLRRFIAQLASSPSEKR